MSFSAGHTGSHSRGSLELPAKGKATWAAPMCHNGELVPAVYNPMCLQLFLTKYEPLCKHGVGPGQVCRSLHACLVGSAPTACLCSSTHPFTLSCVALPAALVVPSQYPLYCRCCVLCADVNLFNLSCLHQVPFMQLFAAQRVIQ